MDLFYKDGSYYLTEINPRFGGGYVHAHELDINFIPLIIRNIEGKVNSPEFGNYKENMLMIMYDDVIIKPFPKVLL